MTCCKRYPDSEAAFVQRLPQVRTCLDSYEHVDPTAANMDAPAVVAAQADLAAAGERQVQINALIAGKQATLDKMAAERSVKGRGRPNAQHANKKKALEASITRLQRGLLPGEQDTVSVGIAHSADELRASAARHPQHHANAGAVPPGRTASNPGRCGSGGTAASGSSGGCHAGANSSASVLEALLPQPGQETGVMDLLGPHPGMGVQPLEPALLDLLEEVEAADDGGEDGNNGNETDAGADNEASSEKSSCAATASAGRGRGRGNGRGRGQRLRGDTELKLRGRDQKDGRSNEEILEERKLKAKVARQERNAVKKSNAAAAPAATCDQ